MISIAKISKLDYKAGRADITLEDREGQVITDVPFLDAIYEMPKVRDAVFVELEEKGGRIKRAVILGRFYTKSNPPVEYGEGIFVKTFSDGTMIKYDPGEKVMELTVETLKVRKLEVEEGANITGNLEVEGDITATGTITPQ